MAERTKAEDTIEARMRRERLANDKISRSYAVCSFPVRVALMASDMHKLLVFSSLHGRTEEIVEALDYMERRICQEFLEVFGHEMIAETFNPSSER